MKMGTEDHPKFKRLRRELGASTAATVGHLELLWHFTALHAPQGDIGKWSDEDIAEACAWEGDVSELIQSLLSTEFVREHPEYRLIVHDWHSHAPAWVSSKLKRGNLEFLTAYSGLDSEATKTPLSKVQEPSICHAMPYPKSKEEQARDLWKEGEELGISSKVIGKAAKKYGPTQTGIALDKVRENTPREPVPYFFGCLNHRTELPQPKSASDDDSRSLKEILGKIK